MLCWAETAGNRANGTQVITINLCSTDQIFVSQYAKSQNEIHDTNPVAIKKTEGAHGSYYR